MMAALAWRWSKCACSVRSRVGGYGESLVLAHPVQVAAVTSRDVPVCSVGGGSFGRGGTQSSTRFRATEGVLILLVRTVAVEGVDLDAHDSFDEDRLTCVSAPSAL